MIFPKILEIKFINQTKNFPENINFLKPFMCLHQEDEDLNSIPLEDTLPLDIKQDKYQTCYLNINNEIPSELFLNYFNICNLNIYQEELIEHKNKLTEKLDALLPYILQILDKNKDNSKFISEEAKNFLIKLSQSPENSRYKKEDLYEITKKDREIDYHDLDIQVAKLFTIENHPECLVSSIDIDLENSLSETSVEFSSKASEYFFSVLLLHLYILLNLMEKTKSTQYIYKDKPIKSCVEIMNIVINQEPQFKILNGNPNIFIIQTYLPKSELNNIEKKNANSVKEKKTLSESKSTKINHFDIPNSSFVIPVIISLSTYILVNYIL